MPLSPATFPDAAALAARPGRTIVYKHSPTCSLCSWSIRQVQALAEQDGVTIEQVDVLAQRPLSREIEAHFGVRHESPQLLIIDDGVVTWHASHQALRVERMRAALAGETAGAGSRL
jgi:bacillithiol system protein YtxJ